MTLRPLPASALVASHMTLSGSGFVDPARIPLRERAEAAAEAGFRGIGVQVADVLGAEGGVDRVLGIPAEYGLEVEEVEFLSGWALAESADAASEVERVALELARHWGPFHLTAGEFGAGPLDVGRAARNLAAICARVADAGIVVAVEPFAWSAIADYELALRIVRLSGAGNAGVLIDVWHWFNTGSTTATLRGIRAEEIAAVQLSDGPRVFDDFMAEARTRRWLPGDGELDVAGLVGALRTGGFSAPFCVEVNHPGFRELPATEAARLAFDKSMALYEHMSA